MNIKREIITAFWALLGLCPCTGRAQTDQAASDEAMQRKFDYYFLESIRQKMQDKYDAGFELLQHCLTIRPHDAAAHYELAQYYLYLNQPGQAEAAMEQAVRETPGNYWYCQALVNLYRQQHEDDKAIALLEHMTRRFPDKTDPAYNLLSLYNQQEKYDHMITLLDSLELRFGKNEQISMEKYRIYQQKNDRKMAFREIEALAAEYPNDLHYQVLLGDAYLQSNKKKEAYGLYRKVLDEEPDNALAMYSMANYYDLTGQKALYEQQIDSLLLNRKVEPDTKMGIMRQLIIGNGQTGKDSLRIINLFDRILQVDTEDASLPMLYAQYLTAKGMNKESIPVLKEVLERDPTNTAARLVLLEEAIRKEDYREVIDLCEAGVEANPDLLEFYFYLAIGYNQAGRIDDALDICQRALKHVNKDSKKEMVSDFYAVIGDLYHAKNMNAEAYEAYETALECNPDNVSALNNYAYYLSLERRDLDKAEEMSYRTVKAEQANATYLDTYAWILFEKGNYAEARLYIDDAMKNDGGKSADVVEHCGDIYYMTGDMEGALKHWEQALEMGSESKTLKQKIEKKKYIPAPAPDKDGK